MIVIILPTHGNITHIKFQNLYKCHFVYIIFVVRVDWLVINRLCTGVEGTTRIEMHEGRDNLNPGSV